MKIRPLKRLGQHFVTDPRVVQDILRLAHLRSGDTILEIGAGHGKLTHPIAQKVKKVIAVEIDRKLCEILRQNFARSRKVQVVEGDFLKLDTRNLIAPTKQIVRGSKVIANLPYYITTPILMKLFREKDLFTHLIIMVQREVADRMAAHPGSRNYGALTLAVRYHSEIEKLVPVGKEAFRPQPKVDSALMSLRIREKPPVQVCDEDLFFSFTRAIFGGRRKMMHNTLLRIASLEKKKAEELLSHAGIDPKNRAEHLSLQQFANLFNQLKNRGKS